MSACSHLCKEVERLADTLGVFEAVVSESVLAYISNRIRIRDDLRDEGELVRC
jgi:hypothetical protein